MILVQKAILLISTKAIQKAIDECASAGGGIVNF